MGRRQKVVSNLGNFDDGAFGVWDVHAGLVRRQHRNGSRAHRRCGWQRDCPSIASRRMPSHAAYASAAPVCLANFLLQLQALRSLNQIFLHAQPGKSAAAFRRRGDQREILASRSRHSLPTHWIYSKPLQHKPKTSTPKSRAAHPTRATPLPPPTSSRSPETPHPATSRACSRSTRSTRPNTPRTCAPDTAARTPPAPWR